MYDLVAGRPQQAEPRVAADGSARPLLGSLQPLPKTGTAARLLVGGSAIGALILCLGLLLTKLLHAGPVQTGDLRTERWLAGHRVPILDHLTMGATWLAETPSAVGVAIVAFFLLRVVLHRWRESWFVATALTGQLLVFLMCTALVDRPRPPVPRLDAAPPTSSFPSGHTGAAVALYGSLAVVVLIHAGRRAWALAIVAVMAVLPFAVAASRLYRGMHYPTDVTAGALNGALWLAVALTALFPGGARSTSSRSDVQGRVS